MRCCSACEVMPLHLLLTPGKETALLPHTHNVDRRSAHKARSCSAGAAPGQAPPAGCSLLLLPPHDQSAQQCCCCLRCFRSTAVSWA